MNQPFSFQGDVGIGETLKSFTLLLTTDLRGGKEQMGLESSDFVLFPEVSQASFLLWSNLLT